MQNFNLPYLAKSVRDFWHRWHISLSTWFADYVYKPLGGNRVSTGRWMFNIMAVYLVSGLWHGANWTFIIWGGIFGVLYILEFLGDKLLKLSLIHISEPTRLLSISYAVFCLKKKTKTTQTNNRRYIV